MRKIVKAPRKSRPDYSIEKAKLNKLRQDAIDANSVKELSPIIVQILERLGAESQ